MLSDLNRVVDALPGLVWTALPDGRFDFLNRRWREYTGLDVEESRGAGWQVAIHAEDLPDLLECWHSIFASGEPREMEARVRRFDGEYRWFLFNTVRWTDASGGLLGWCGTASDIEERTRAKEAFPMTERRFRLIFDDLPALVCLLKPAGGVELVNRRCMEFFGATLEEMKSWKLRDVIHPDDLEEVEAAWNRAVETGDPYEVDGRHRRADGVYRWLHMRALNMRDSQGHVLFWYLVQTDIDEQKRAESLLAGEKQLLEMVASGRPLREILVTLCDVFNGFAETFSSGVLLLDRTRSKVQRAIAPALPAAYNEDLEGRPVSSIEGPCGMAANLKSQVVVCDVTTDRRWDGQSWPIRAEGHGLKSWWSTPILSLKGDLLGTFAIHGRESRTPTPYHQALIEQFTHIASIAIERTRSQEALMRSEAFLAEAQHLSSTGSFSWQVATGEITWSEQVYRIYELDPNVPVTIERIYDRTHPEDLPFMREVTHRARAGEAVDFGYEHRLQMPDGSIKYLHTVAHGACDESGQLEYIGAIQDVTHRRRSEEALDKVRSELAHVARVTTLGALTASIAHEVNQPLSGIITNASTCLRMLAADPPNVDGARETARRTIRDGHRASDVITRLRALFAKRATTAESVDLNEATREVIALSLNELQRSRVIVRAELADELPPVVGDRVQLQQVILNLVLNASDAMSAVEDRPRQIVIRTGHDAQDDSVRLDVRDSGVGFDTQDAQRLFDAFYTTKSDGMGIGLSVSRSIIESHQGRLWAEPNEGPGATFSFSVRAMRNS